MPLFANAGAAILFVCFLVLVTITSTWLVSYAAHSFFAVIQETAAGNDEVVWPDEPLATWLGAGALLAWHVLVWLMPVGLVLRAIDRDFFIESTAWAVVCGGVVIWLFFPIGVLSSMSGTSRWMFFSPKLLAGLARVAPVTLGFYAATPLLLGLSLTAWSYAFARWKLLIPVAAAVSAASFLIYARLLGRVAWKLNRLKTGKRPARKREVSVTSEQIREQEPWEMSGKRKKRKVLKPPSASAYGLAPEEEAPRPVLPSDGYAPVGVLPPVETPPGSASEMAQPSEFEERISERPKVRLNPPWTLFSGVFNFPFYEKSLGAFTFLMIGSAFVAFVISVMRLP